MFHIIVKDKKIQKYNFKCSVCVGTVMIVSYTERRAQREISPILSSWGQSIGAKGRNHCTQDPNVNNIDSDSDSLYLAH